MDIKENVLEWYKGNTNNEEIAEIYNKVTLKLLKCFKPHELSTVLVLLITQIVYEDRKERK